MCCSGRASRAAHGGGIRVLRRESAAIWRCCSGRASRGCPWDARTCAFARERGHLEVLIWAREQGCPDEDFNEDSDEDG